MFNFFRRNIETKKEEIQQEQDNLPVEADQSAEQEKEAYTEECSVAELTDCATVIETPDIVSKEPCQVINEPECLDNVEFIEPEKQEKKSFFGISFSSLKHAISKTSESLVGNVLDITRGREKIDDDLLDEIEEKLIKADLGVNTAVDIIEKLRDQKNRLKPDEIGSFLKEEFVKILNGADSSPIELNNHKLNIFLVTGVNGAGKTTLIGKLAHRFKLQGKRVLVAAGDTFRAAAEDQLEIWTQRAGAEIVRQDGADPASVVFDAINKAKETGADVLLVDTAGRLQNKFNLMEELRKIKRIIDREASGMVQESILVLDATTGQNGLKQAEVFKEAVQLTSVALTKLDGSARGGIIIGITKELGLPVKLIGVGEKLDDMKDFNPHDFVNALFD